MQDVFYRIIEAAEDQLRFHGQDAVLVIATDRLVLDEKLLTTIRRFQTLLVTIILRILSTKEEPGSLDWYERELENLGIQVLGDCSCHQNRAARFNPWLNYAMPLHHCRELGYHPRILTLLERKRLNKDELRAFLVVLFGKHVMFGAPDIHAQWPEFFLFLHNMNSASGRHLSPTGGNEPWLNMQHLAESFCAHDPAVLLAMVKARRQSRTLSATTVIEI